MYALTGVYGGMGGAFALSVGTDSTQAVCNTSVAMMNCIMDNNVAIGESRCIAPSCGLLQTRCTRVVTGLQTLEVRCQSASETTIPSCSIRVSCCWTALWTITKLLVRYIVRQLQLVSLSVVPVSTFFFRTMLWDAATICVAMLLFLIDRRFKWWWWCSFHFYWWFEHNQHYSDVGKLYHDGQHMWSFARIGCFH